jgi:hypothetical protein
MKFQIAMVSKRVPGSVFTKVFPVIILIILLSGCSGRKGSDQLDYVDPSIGGVGLLLQPTRPVVQLPNQMIRVYPTTR